MFRRSINHTCIMLPAVIMACLFNACRSGEPRTIVTIPQLRQLVSDAIKNSDTSLKELTVSGYFVNERAPMLITDLNLMRTNAIIPDSAYVLLTGAGVDSLVANGSQDTSQRYVGAIVHTDVDLKVDPGMLHNANGLTRRIANNNPVVKLLIRKKPNIEIAAGKVISYINKSVQSIWPDDQSKAVIPKTDPNKVALLYSGGYDSPNSHLRYWNDLQYMYATLTHKYGFSSGNIIVVYRDGAAEPGQRKMPVNYPATESDFRTAVNVVKSKLNTQSTLFVFFSNHGGGFLSDSNRAEGGRPDENNDEEITDLRKWDEEMYFYDQGNNNNLHLWDDSLSLIFSNIKCKNFVILLEPCFGGGFIHDLRGGNRVIISASSEYEYSYGDYSSKGTNFDTFSYYFTAALNGAVGTDVNNDGRISMLEAFNYAKSKDKESEHPQFDDSGDWMGTISPDSNGTYGRLANKTFLK